MHPILGTDWQKTLWKIVANPALEVVAAIVVVLFASWILIQGETEARHSAFPVPHVKH
jgi:hypothetical protein